jgi:P4 family phage/plasmid primase-like protien
LVIAGNHKPSLRSVDEAVKRRFHLVPFTQTIAENERDAHLPEKLEAEWPGILSWAIRGCLEWQRIGLSPPPTVRAATESYLAEEDTIGQFLAECCLADDRHAATEVNALFAAWWSWAQTAGEQALTIRRFSTALVARGFERGKDAATRRAIIHGLRLRKSGSGLGPGGHYATEI